MRVFSALVILVIAVSLAMMLTTPASANLIVNGSFENPDILGGYQFYLEPIPGWGLTPCDPNSFPGYSTLGVVIIDSLIGWNSYSGNQFATLDTWYNSGIFQTVNTVAGETYNIDFAYSPRIGNTAASNTIELYINDILIDSISADGVGLNNTSWSERHYAFAATGTSSTIKFLAAGISDGNGGFIDDVRLTATSVPESSTMLLFGSGLAGLVGYSRRRMNKEVVGYKIFSNH